MNKRSQNTGGLAALVALAVFCLAHPAVAQVTFIAGNNPQNEQNIFLNTGTSGATVFGTTQNGPNVQFTSTTDTLTEPSQGQARINPSDGSVNNLTISVPGGTFTDFIANAKDLNSTLTLTVFSSGGTQTFTEAAPKGNGQSFFTLVANSGITINSVTLNSTAGFGDLRQPRISGAVLTPVAVPEPSQTASMGLGLLGLAGLMLRARKRQTRQIA